MEAGEIPGGSPAKGAARTAAHGAAPWIERLARLGFAAKGTVYILVGGLAAAAALAGGAATKGWSGALASLADETWGRLLLGLIALGLAGYVTWRAVSAVLNPEHDSAGKRLYNAGTALVHAGLAFEAGRLGVTRIGGRGDDATHWSAELMQQPFGQILLGLVGLAVLFRGLYQLWRAWRVDLDDRLALGMLSHSARPLIVGLSRFGLAARGVVFAIIGSFLLVAAIQADPSEARGVGGALGWLRDTPWLLGVVAFGLIAYGLYELVRARYRRIRAV